MKYSHVIFVFLLAAAVMGCATVSPPSSSNSNLANAKQLYEAKRYFEAIPRLQIDANQPENSKVRQEARFFLGMSFYHIDGYKDAIQMLHTYLEDAPSGEFAAEAKKQITLIQAKYDALYPSIETLDKRIAELTQKTRLSEGEILVLADLIWQTGRYEESAKHYVALATSNSKYKSESPITERIDIRADGSYTVLTPDEISRRDIIKEPVQVINSSSFRSGRDRRTGIARHFVVSGQVINRSQDVQGGIVVDVTIYGFGNLVYDTRRHPVGRMHPGETRAFSLRFSNFESQNNIDRYECTVSYQ
jgi:tetratricopeptide (TPR) repeat protein